MKIPRLIFALARLSYTLFILLTSTFCLLTYIPFTYHQVKLGGLFPWVITFSKIHHYLHWVALVVLVLTVLSDLRNPRSRMLTVGFLIFNAAAGVALLIHPLLAGLKNNGASLVWSLASLVPLLWLAAIDWVGHSSNLKWGEPAAAEDRRILGAAWQTAVFLSILYTAIFYVRFVLQSHLELGGRERLVAELWGLVCNLLIFMAVFVALILGRAIASLFRVPVKAEFLLFVLLAVLLVRATITGLIFPAISFGGRMAEVVAVAVACSLAASTVGLCVRIHPPSYGLIEGGLGPLVSLWTFGRLTRLPSRIASILAISLAAYLLATRMALMDWNFLLQKTSVLFVWAAAFSSFYIMVPRLDGKPARSLFLLIPPIATLLAYETLRASQPRWQKVLGGSSRDVAASLDRYAGYDISFKLVHDMLTPVRSGNVFYEFLSKNTNIPQSTRVEPVDIKLVDNLLAGAGAKPNIFIIVIDSLRRDYLSCYNPSVTFTPSLGAFAEESTVMENAFTHYGGTGLSEPSIWVGGMMVHKQYVTPFFPMNSLQKLIEVEKYQSFVSKDSILSVILGPASDLTELDQGTLVMNYDLCKTLSELTRKLRERADASRPVFAYTQPQNIHISVINREGRSVPAGESYPGFDAPYASRLRRIDGCFGEFIKSLKSAGLYDRSIIVFTADHGDSLGEDGRWGHAYTIFPEVVRIPLLIHLPPSIRASVSADPNAATFLTDITPSLYYLLGHKPTVRNEIFGRPLFTASPDERTAYLRDSYLMTSSYGPVYGILRNNGGSLYIVDGVNFQDYSFTLRERSPDSSEPVMDAMRTGNARLIREYILAIDRYYKFSPPP